MPYVPTNRQTNVESTFILALIQYVRTHHTHSHTLTHTYSHTHTHSHSLTHSLTHTHSDDDLYANTMTLDCWGRRVKRASLTIWLTLIAGAIAVAELEALVLVLEADGVQVGIDNTIRSFIDNTYTVSPYNPLSPIQSSITHTILYHPYNPLSPIRSSITHTIRTQY